MNYIKYILIITFSTSVISGDYSDQRGMTKLLGTETTLRCAEQMMQPGAKTYELSYERTGTMPKSPFAGEYKPKFLPELGWPGSVHIYTMDVLNADVNDGNQGTQMDALGHFGYVDEVWNGEGELDTSKIKYFNELTTDEVKPTPESPLQKLGIETVPPIVTTAVLIDVRKHIFNGVAMDAGQYVTVDHVKKTIAKSSLKDRGILPGDVVLINTGWSDNLSLIHISEPTRPY